MYIPTGPREAILLETVNTLLDARRTGVTLPDLPVELQPASLDEVYWVQDNLVKAYGEIGGYKVGATTPDATPIFAPMPLAWMGPSGTTIAAAQHRFRGLESEVAFLMGEDLPPRATPYTPAEVYAAVASAHPAIEILESGLTDPTLATRNSMLADLQMHGGFIYGPACPAWTSVAWDKFDYAHETVAITVDGSIRVERTGSNTAGDLNRLLPWLANEGTERTGGLKAGQWITTGSWTGYTLASAGSTATAHFATIGSAALRFE
jgi:2-keto-4-pentenoate hydratase